MENSKIVMNKKYVYGGIGIAVAIVAILVNVYFLISNDETSPSLNLDFTYDEANSKLKESMNSNGIEMSSALKFSQTKDIEKWCKLFDDTEKQNLVKYCTSTELKDSNGNFLGNIYMVGSTNAPGLVAVTLQSDPMMSQFEKIKTVFRVVIEDLVCDCWEEVKPGGYKSIVEWLDALRDFHIDGEKPHSESKLPELALKHLQIELTTNRDGYFWELLIAR